MLAFLALGGGTGHLLRAVAFARAASARGHRVRVLASSPFTRAIAGALAPEGVDITVATGDAASVRAFARAWLAAGDDEALVVDTFPRGLVGELDGVAASCPRVLVHRDLTDAYALRGDVRRAAEAFDVIVAPGEDGPYATAPTARATAPWIVAASVPRQGRDAARASLGLGPGDDRPVVAVVTTGDDDEARALRDLARSLAATLRDVHVVDASLDRPDAPLPLARSLAGVDLLVGAGGYHLVHEARATATPLVALPSARAYDAQSRRLRPDERAATLDDVAARIRRATPRTASPPASIEDGAAEGVRIVEDVIDA